MRWRCVLALALLLGAAFASTAGSGGDLVAAAARVAGFHAQAPPPSVRKGLRRLDAGLARLSRDVKAARVLPGSRALRLRIIDLLLRQAGVAGALPGAPGTPFAILHGQLTAIEGALDSAREAAAFSATSAPVRAALLPGRTEARRLERELRPRAARAARSTRALTKKLEALIARLKASRTIPATNDGDLRELARLASAVAGALPNIYGAGFAGVHLRLRWLGDSLANALYTRHGEDTLRFLADGAASAGEVERALGLAAAARRSRSGRDAASTGGRASTSTVPESVSESLRRLDVELEKLRDQVEAGEIDSRSMALWKRLDELRSLKLSLMNEFPELFHFHFAFFYSTYLEKLDDGLEAALERASEIAAIAAREEGFLLSGQATTAAQALRLNLLDADRARNDLENHLKSIGAPASLLAKLKQLHADITSAFSDAKHVYDDKGAKKLLQAVGELLQLKASVLDEFPPVFGAAFIDVYLNLKWVDNALRQAGPMSWNARDVLRSLLNAITFKQKLERVLAKPTPGPFSVGIGVMHDHDPPQSDACVTVSTSPPQPGARAKVSLRGRSHDSAATPSEQEVTLDGDGRALARFLVNSIDAWDVEVEVKTEDGRSAGATVSFDNSTATAEPCR